MRFFYLFLLVAFSGFLQAQPKSIYRFSENPDVNTGSNFIEFWKEFNGKLLFEGTGEFGGYTLQVTDGTAEGTKLIKSPTVSWYSTPRRFTEVNGTLYFFADAGLGYQLGKTDGTDEGTIMFDNAFATVEEFDLTRLGTSLYFPGYNETVGGVELCKYDINSGIASIVKEIVPGDPGSSGDTYTYALGASSNYVFFNADDGVHGKELWRSDGTEEGTVLVKDINPTGSSISDKTTFLSAGDVVYFVANDGGQWDQLWKSDGTEEGTVAITTFQSGVLEGLAFLNGKIFFRGYNFAGLELYTTEGTPGDAQLLNDISGTGSSLLDYHTGFFEFNEELYYVTDADGTVLWRTDGTSGGTHLVGDIGVDPFSSFRYQILDDHLWLQVESINATTKDQLWKADENGVELVIEGDLTQIAFTNSISKDQHFPKLGNKLIFCSNEDFIGYEPHLFDPVTNELTLIKDVNSLVATPPSNMISIGDKVLFTGTDRVHGKEPWVTDGKSGGTKLLKDFAPGEGSGLMGSVARFRDKAVLRINGANNAEEVWLSDGTEAGTTLLKDFDRFTSSMSYASGVFNDRLYFFSSDGKLWKSDGTTEGTTVVKDLVNDLDYEKSALALTKFAATDDALYFIVNYFELWRTDGTEAGTMKVKVFNTESEPFKFSSPVIMAGKSKIYIQDRTGDALLYQIWVSDGTEEGTHVIKEVTNESFYYITNRMTMLLVWNDLLYFNTSSSAGSQLWRTDGTEEGTFELHGPFDQIGTSEVFNNGSYVLISPGIEGTAIVKSDGTNEGTVAVSTPGGGFTYASGFYKHVDNNLYFQGYSESKGGELWKSDIEISEFYPASEITPGPISSGLQQMASAGNILVMLAWNGAFWSLDPTQEITFDEIGEITMDESPITLYATASSGLPIEFTVTSGNATIDGDKLTVTSTGSITVKASQAGNGDYNSTSIEQTFDANEVEVVLGLEENLGVGFYPNPATNVLMVSSPRSFQTLILHDILGRKVTATSVNQDQTSLDVSHLPRGMYIARLISADNKVIERKVVLK